MYNPTNSNLNLRREWQHVESSQPLLATKPSSSHHHSGINSSNSNSTPPYQQHHHQPDAHFSASQIRPTLSVLQRSFHQLNAELRDLSDFLQKLTPPTLTTTTTSPPPPMTITEYDRITFNLKKKRQKTKNSLAHFLELIKECKTQNWAASNRVAHRELERLLQSFEEGYPRMQNVIGLSVTREKEIVNQRLDQLNRQDRVAHTHGAAAAAGVDGTVSHSWNHDNDQHHMDPEEGFNTQKQLEVPAYDQSAIDAEREIGREKLNDLKQVEEEVNELLECYMDLKETLLDQQDGIDEIEHNFVSANVEAEQGISRVREANEYQKQGNSIIYGTMCAMILVFLVCSVILFAVFYF